MTNDVLEELEESGEAFGLNGTRSSGKVRMACAPFPPPPQRATAAATSDKQKGAGMVERERWVVREMGGEREREREMGGERERE
jgi:hypothetical protein